MSDEQKLTDEVKPKRDPRALNAYRHGLTGQVHIGTVPEQEAYDKHCEIIHQSLAPVGGIEIELVQTIADDQWRLKRGKAIEGTAFGMGIATGNYSTNNHPEAFGAMAMAGTWFKDAKSIALLGLYLHRIDRAIEKNIKFLKQLQAERHAALQKAAEESNLLAELAESKRETYDAGRDFPREILAPQFVFSNLEIARLATHLRRIQEGKTRLKARQNFARKAA